VEEIAASTPRALAMGPFGSDIKTDNFVPEGVPVIRGVNLNAERFMDDGFVYLTEEKADELSAANAFALDIVFTHRGTIGQVGIIPPGARYGRYIVSQSQMKLTCDQQKVDPRFIFYFFRSRTGQHELLANTSTTGVPAISRPLTSLKAIRVPLPPRNEQGAIASILWALDDKIELNRRMNRTLEAMARAIFRSWFVDFDPVRAKGVGADLRVRPEHGQTHRSAPTSNTFEWPQHILGLFPNSFQDSELGEIPKGWKVGRLDDLLILQRGFDLPLPNRVPGPYPVIAASGDNGTHNEFMVRGPGVTTGRSGVLGRVFFIHNDFWPLNTSLWVKEFKGCTPAYAFHLMTGLGFDTFNAGSAVPTLNRNHVHNLPVVVPPRPVVEAFDHVALAVLQRQKAADGESKKLGTLRDTLLPKLISGELRVPDAERIVGRCV
jgi:type I restriction enzyme S subunit